VSFQDNSNIALKSDAKKSNESNHRDKKKDKDASEANAQLLGTTQKVDQKINLRAELVMLENVLEDLKVKYEQYFSSILHMPPDSLHNEVRKAFKRIRKSPFRSSAVNYKLKCLEIRYNTYNTYWQRVLKERENGVYIKDVFKANLREKIAQEEARAATSVGAAERGLRNLFDSYKTTLEKQTGKVKNLDFKAFQDSLLQKAKQFKETHGAKKLVFKIVVKEGKVLVKAVPK
jgi:hypothetical protein